MYAFRGALVCALCFLAVASLASADVNPTPIAVPLIGDQGVGSPYPSRIHLVSRAVTHPCPEELAVLPMRTNGTIVNKYLLMSHAGSCRPLQGTDLVFSARRHAHSGYFAAGVPIQRFLDHDRLEVEDLDVGAEHARAAASFHRDRC
jgi:hypothetical protein